MKLFGVSVILYFIKLLSGYRKSSIHYSDSANKLTISFEVNLVTKGTERQSLQKS